MHWIRRHILEQLLYEKVLRNRDLRPKRVESNLFQYHLQELCKDGFVVKTDGGYTLAPLGLAWADKYSSELKSERPQPKINTVVAVYNSAGEILLMKRTRQPFLGTYQFPAGKLHRGELLSNAAIREVYEKVGLENAVLEEKGWVHNIISDDELLVSDYVGFVFAAQSGVGFTPKGDTVWVRLEDDFNTQAYMPGVAVIVDMLKNIMSHNERVINISKNSSSTKYC